MRAASGGVTCVLPVMPATASDFTSQFKHIYLQFCTQGVRSFTFSSLHVGKERFVCLENTCQGQVKLPAWHVSFCLLTAWEVACEIQAFSPVYFVHFTWNRRQKYLHSRAFSLTFELDTTCISQVKLPESFL